VNEREEWIQKYIQKQIDGMIFGSELQKQHAIEQARRKAEGYLQEYQGQPRGNPGNPQRVFTYGERIKQAIKEDPVVGWTHALNMWDNYLTLSEKEELRMLWIYQGKEEFTKLHPSILHEIAGVGEPLTDFAQLFQAIDRKILLGR